MGKKKIILFTTLVQSKELLKIIGAITSAPPSHSFSLCIVCTTYIPFHLQ